jgi:hypothetical protein
VVRRKGHKQGKGIISPSNRLTNLTITVDY